MDINEILINECGLEIANEKLAGKMRELMKHKDEENFKEKLQELIIDRDELAKGNMNVIKKYMGDVNNG